MKKLLQKQLIKLVERSKKYKFDKIAAIESRGFVFASAVSYLLKNLLYA